MIFATSLSDFLQPLKEHFDDAVWTVLSTYYGPDTFLNSFYSLTPYFSWVIEVSTLIFLILQRRKLRHKMVGK